MLMYLCIAREVLLGIYHVVLIVWGIRYGQLITTEVLSDPWEAHVVTASPGSIIYPVRDKWIREEI